ncbi:hypothetical protein [Legionella clemsonensis]|uniref:Uncharacterized protein n=1 Tax=Legionella clemsonensis TaxID=1867846 RepID=A0A222P3A0_9GAMM|nr:hypothetical protein [Legionella clemsonensis]ASQ46334.1 hypothetical protein clem_08915 [Legionella clemsonensis]
MIFFARIVASIIIGLLCINTSIAARSDNFYRNFWLPKYHGERLNYCNFDGKECGLALATRYCKLMGYAYADQQIIDHNVGLTNFLFCNARCKGWRCNGFKTIRCVANMSHNPPRAYHYRLRRYVYPRFNNYRVDWCYNGRQGCGRRAAFSFCRRMGYLSVRRYAIEKHIAATEAIGNQKLCFGILCNAFKYIDCYR